MKELSGRVSKLEQKTHSEAIGCKTCNDQKVKVIIRHAGDPTNTISATCEACGRQAMPFIVELEDAPKAKEPVRFRVRKSHA